MSVFVKSFCWYDVLFNTKAWQAFVARQKEMQKDRVTLENEVHQLQAANRDYVRKLLDRDQKLDECRNRIAVLSGAAHAENLPYQVKGTHGQTEGPKSRPRTDVPGVVSSDMASESNRRRRNDRDPLESPQPDNSALLTATAFAVVDSDFRAHVVEVPQVQATEGYPGSPSHTAQQCSPVYSAPEPAPSRSESYSSPSRSESYDSPSSNNDSSPGGCD
jgi:hypothetical protein